MAPFRKIVREKNTVIISNKIRMLAFFSSFPL